MLWRQLGDLVNGTTGLGLHRFQDSMSQISIASEMRKRTWAAVFSIDMTIASFTGRPPGLSHRYSSCPLPLDLNDEILLASKDDLAHAVSLLDSNGWNTVGDLSPATTIRATMCYSLIMAEILEISLGTDSQYSDQRLM